MTGAGRLGAAATSGVAVRRLAAGLLLAVWATALAVADERQEIRVLHVIDGDTVTARADGRELRVRFLGVDAPEKGKEGRPGEPYARAATQFTRDLLSRAERVELEVAGDRVDEYGRTLGFLWLGLPGQGDPVNLSEELLRQGLARAMRRFQYPGKERFLVIEADARRARRGLWRGGGR